MERQLLRLLFDLDQDRQTTREHVWDSISKEMEFLNSPIRVQENAKYKCIMGAETSLAAVSAKIFVEDLRKDLYDSQRVHPGTRQ